MLHFMQGFYLPAYNEYKQSRVVYLVPTYVPIRSRSLGIVRKTTN
jgi:hypothetical protein